MTVLTNCLHSYSLLWNSQSSINAYRTLFCTIFLITYVPFLHVVENSDENVDGSEVSSQRQSFARSSTNSATSSASETSNGILSSIIGLPKTSREEIEEFDEKLKRDSETFDSDVRTEFVSIFQLPGDTSMERYCFMQFLNNIFQVTGITKHNPALQRSGNAVSSSLKLIFAITDDKKQLIDYGGKIDFFLEWIEKMELYSILSG